MRVLIVGGNKLDESLLYIWRGFKKTTPHVSHIVSRRPTEEGRIALARDLLEAVRGFKPDILFWWVPKMGADYQRGVIDFLKSNGRDFVSVYYTIDDPYFMDHGAKYIWEAFDVCITCCAGSMQTYRDHGKHVLLLYPPVDEEVHGNAKYCSEFSCDFMFAATNCYDKINYPKILVERRELAMEAARIGSLHLYGNGDNRPGGWMGVQGTESLRPHFRGWRGFTELFDYYRSAKIVLNSHVRPDGFMYLNERQLTAMACGGFVLVDAVNGIGKIFEVGEEMDTWRTLDEFKSKANYWLHHETERQAAAIRGQQKVLTRHNNERFAKEVLRLCAQIK